METGTKEEQDLSVAISALRTEAHRLLHAFRVAAEKVTATEGEQSDAKTAHDIINTAEEGSLLVQGACADPRVISSVQWIDLYETMGEELQEVCSAADMERILPPIEKAMMVIWNGLPRTTQDLATSLQQFEWRGWNEACERLTARRNGLAFNATHTGEA